MNPLRLIADDLTGALDTTAQFVEPGRPIPVFLNGELPGVPPEAFAIDSATRERDEAFAAATATRLAPILAPGHSVLAYRKVDSLLRGHAGAELLATLRALRPRYCVIAPAFPLHGRVTRGGRQFARVGGSWKAVGEDLGARLKSLGTPVHLCRPGDRIPEGTSLWDADTNLDLIRIASAGADLPEAPLWCGSGGLAGAIARRDSPGVKSLAKPVLGILGSDHAATAGQLAACGPHVVWLPGGETAAHPVNARLEAAGFCLLGFDLGAGMNRPEAALEIARRMARLVQTTRTPRSLVVSGGETLRALCLSLGTTRLDVVGQVMPGVPVSRMIGGRWDRVQVVSKSGAFGEEDLLLKLLSLASS
jgi:uncharacterized protein YgbK (DUF1537 family)